AALVLESIGDTVYVRNGEVAERREVRLGYDEGDHVEVVAGLEEGDEVIVLGQDSLADGTPVYVLGEEAPPTAPTAGGVGAAAPAGGGPPPGFDPTRMTPEMEERARARMRERGLDDAQIEERLRQMRNGELRPGGQGAGGPPGAGRSGP
ncbi:MAG: hypothetical protein R3190_07780, partial [Thermoanaerobaculia bacterium]|nr:hypothetical protein [Thermoanaerobaculia bacterium]